MNKTSSNAALVATSIATAAVATKRAPKAAPRYASLRNIELQILEKEGVCVVFRGAPEILISGGGYTYKNRLKSSATIKHLKKRIAYALRTWKGAAIDYVIVQGNGRLVRTGWENQLITKITDSYVAGKAMAN